MAQTIVTALILNEDYTTREELDLEPHCGKDFCDSCGDCLRCNPEDCYDNGGGWHTWAIYADQVGDFKKRVGLVA